MGLFLGLVFGFMMTVDPMTRSHFFEFVTAHGPFELTGIVLSGAAGMRMGLGLFASDGQSRLKGLQASSASRDADSFGGRQPGRPCRAHRGLCLALFLKPDGKRAVGLMCAFILLFYMGVLRLHGAAHGAD